MTCDKCVNVHAAQLAGVTSNPCECECHDKTAHFIIDYITTTSDGEVCSCSMAGCEIFKL